MNIIEFENPEGVAVLSPVNGGAVGADDLDATVSQGLSQVDGSLAT